MTGPGSEKEAQVIEETRVIKAIIEDALVCEDCSKTDVCVILHMLTQQHMNVSEFLSELKSKYKVKIDIRTSITKCDHRPEDLVVR